MKYMLSAALFFSAAFFSTTQAQQAYGTVGRQQISPAFVEMLQLINPEFGLTPDKKSFESRIEKYYIRSKANAEAMRQSKMDQDPEVKKNIDLLKQLAEEKYLSYLYDKKKDMSYTATDAEVHAYYAAHKNEFATPGVYTYLLASIHDTVKYPIMDIAKKMKVYATTLSDEFKVGDKNDYYIVLNKKRQIPATDSEYKLMSALQEGETSKPHSDGDRVVLYYLIERKNSTIQPFEEVKDNCRNILINQKHTQAEEDFRSKMRKDYPVDLNGDFFK